MNAYLVESLAPLVFRAGKPFGSQASAQELTFPLPSTGAGLIRYLALSQGKVADSYKDSDYQKLLQLQCYGVYLAKFDDGTKPTIFVPKPTNVLCLEIDGKKQLIRLAPKAFDEECGSDLPNGLLPIQPQFKDEKSKGKPKNDIKYWQLTDVIKWQKGENLDYDTIAKNGLTNIPIDIRTHNALDDESLAVSDGDLFQTASFDMSYQKNGNDFDDKRLGFVILSEQTLDDDVATLGGERRLSYFKKLPQNPILTHATTQDLNQAGGFCLTFLTPAIFEKGYLPSWIDDKTKTGTLPSGATVKLTAVAVERWQAVSGWDSTDWKPKATRRGVPVGSVYWFDLAGQTLSDDDVAFLSQPLADNAYDKADGFGMALLTAFNVN